MKYATLDHRRRSQGVLWCLTAVTVLCVIAGAVTVLLHTKHPTAAKIFFLVGYAGAVAAATFTIHYGRHHRAFTKSMTYAVILYAMGCMITAAALFSGGPGSFSGAVLHAAAEGLVSAQLLVAAGASRGRGLGIWAALAGFLTGLTILLSLDAKIATAVFFLAPIAAVLLSGGREPVARCFGRWIILATIVAGLSLGLVRLAGGSEELCHAVLHLLLVLVGLAALLRLQCAVPGRQEQPEPVPAGQTLAAAAVVPEPATVCGPAAEPAALEAPEGRKNKEEFDDRWIIKKYKGLSPAELLQAPVDALYGVSAGDAELLQEAFGIKTIGDLADNKFFAWAAEIAGQAKEE